MFRPVIIIIFTQLLFTTSDLLARSHMPKQGFSPATFVSGWFFAYFAIRIIAMFGQLYVFTITELGKTMAFFGAVSIILVNILGILVLKEVLSTGAYLGVTFAVIAFIILAFT